MSLSSQTACRPSEEEEYKQEKKMTVQKLHKVRTRAHKWMVQFNALMHNAHAKQTVSKTCVDNVLESTCCDNDSKNSNSEYDGFVVLNGGMHAGCTQYEVRRLLIDMNVLHENKCARVEKVKENTKVVNCNVDYSTQTFRYGSTLPFVVVNAPMNTKAACLSHIIVTNTRKEYTIQRPKNCTSLMPQEKKVTAENKEEDIAVVDTTTTVENKNNFFLRKNDADGGEKKEEGTIVYVLPVPLSRQLWNQGSSVNFNCGFLFMVRCRTSTIVDAFAEYFSKPVLGVELFAQTHLHDKQHVVESNKVSSIIGDETNHVRRLRCISLEQIPGLLCIPEFLTQKEHDNALHEMMHILEESTESSRPSANAKNNVVTNDDDDDDYYTESAQHKRGKKEYLSRRHVVHFNRRFIYESNTMGEVGDGVGKLPSFYYWMRERIANASCEVMIEPPYPFAYIGKGDSTTVNGKELNGKSNEERENTENSGWLEKSKLQSDEYGVDNNSENECDQLTANYYYTHARGKSASGIAAHVDAHSSIGEYIFIVSLGSYTVMDFVRAASTNPNNNNKNGLNNKAFSVYIPARSLVVMSGESRYGWTHCIAEKRSDTLHETLPTQTRGDRISLTWRRGRREVHYKANCSWPELCDGQEEHEL